VEAMVEVVKVVEQVEVKVEVGMGVV